MPQFIMLTRNSAQSLNVRALPAPA